MRRDGVVAVHLDPADIKMIAWACRGCRYELVRGRIERRAAATHEAAQRAQRDRDVKDRQEALDAIGTLPADVVAAVHAEAARGWAGLTLRPEAPLYQMRLAAAIRRYLTR